MNKKVLTTAVGAILAGAMGIAQAGDVTVYGNVNVSLDAIDQDAGRGGADDVTMESNTSSVGVRGSEDLGNGLKAIFQAEFQFDADEQSGISDRDQFVGLAGNFGKVRFGTLSTSYKSHGAMIDPIYRTSLQGRSNGLQSATLHSGAGETRGRMNNHVRYDSPDMNGLGLTVDYAFDQMTATENDTFGIGGHYKNGAILAFADYITSDEGGDLDDAWKIGGSFGINEMFSVYGQYEAGGLLGSDEDAQQWVIAGSATMGNTMLYLGYGQAEELTSNTYEHDAVTLAVDHHLSKRTDIYAGWAQTDVDGSGEEDLISVGLRHKF